MAYNEGANIEGLLDSLLSQKTYICSIEAIFVVASGCTDNTEALVEKYAHMDKRIKLLIQKEREGKASAINLFLSVAKGDIFILASADTVLEMDAVNNLVKPFTDPIIGMTGGRPIPINNTDNFIGFTVNLLWRMHHRVALEHPKMGELVAFRNIVKMIPHDTAVDEASIEAMITEVGYRLKYVEGAVLYNKGAENVRDLLKQRRRIAAGHLHLKRSKNYSVSTTSWKIILKSFLKEIRWGTRTTFWTIGAVILEVSARLLGCYDFYIKKKNPFIWDIASSTKGLGKLETSRVSKC
jgi:cellulose synthase/poly-beta-1,6-N-acetylglucosamine synthase-like glycosyltransferase